MKFRGHFGLKLDDLEHLGVLVEGGGPQKTKNYKMKKSVIILA